jgi:hypothetical protein
VARGLSAGAPRRCSLERIQREKAAKFAAKNEKVPPSQSHAHSPIRAGARGLTAAATRQVAEAQERARVRKGEASPPASGTSPTPDPGSPADAGAAGGPPASTGPRYLKDGHSMSVRPAGAVTRGKQLALQSRRKCAPRRAPRATVYCCCF